MYCENCGANIDDNAKFCPLCGEKTNKEVEYKLSSVRMYNERPKLLKEIENAKECSLAIEKNIAGLNYMKQKLNEIDECIANPEAHKNEVDKFVKRPYSKSPTSDGEAGIKLFKYIGIGFVLFFLWMMAEACSYAGHMLEFSIGVMVAISILFSCKILMKYSSIRQDVIKLKQLRDEEQSEIDKMYARCMDLYRGYTENGGKIPYEYLSDNAKIKLDFMHDAIYDGRAATIEDALQLCKNELNL